MIFLLVNSIGNKKEMFKLNLTSNNTLKNVLMLLIILVVIYVVYQIYKNYIHKEGFENEDDQDQDQDEEKEQVYENYENDQPEEPMMMMPSEQQDNVIENMNENPVNRDMRNAQMMGMGGDQLSAQDLLPQDKSSTWANVNPEGQGTLEGKNFLQAGYHIGINTVGQTLRNANLQLRSEPPAPQVQVSPWLQSTIEPDISRRPMEIGGCA
jgi:cell division protein FtsN